MCVLGTMGKKERSHGPTQGTQDTRRVGIDVSLELSSPAFWSKCWFGKSATCGIRAASLVLWNPLMLEGERPRVRRFEMEELGSLAAR